MSMDLSFAPGLNSKNCSMPEMEAQKPTSPIAAGLYEGIQPVNVIEDAVTFLLKYIDHERPLVRIIAIRVLGRMVREHPEEVRRAVPFIVKALRDNSPEVRLAAANTLRAIELAIGEVELSSKESE
jgi:hypothetical protein